MMTQARGRIVRGLRAASGRSRLMHRGTIALQLRHFRAVLPDFDAFFDGPLHLGTLNVEVPRRLVRVGAPALHLRQIAWERGMTENFFLSPCTLRFFGKDHRGLLYIPDPETKPAGLPVGHVLEVLTARVPFIHYGSPVRLTFDSAAVTLVPKRRTSRAARVRKVPRRPRPDILPA